MSEHTISDSPLLSKGISSSSSHFSCLNDSFIENYDFPLSPRVMLELLPELSPAQFKVFLFALFVLWNERAYIYPISLKIFARYTGLSERIVRKAKAELVKRKVFCIFKLAGKEDSIGINPLYLEPIPGVPSESRK